MEFSNTDVFETAEHIWRTALGLELVSSDEPFALESVERLIATIHFEGGFEGQVSLECSRSLAVHMASAMFGMDESELSEEDIADAIHEMTNITGGRLKAMTPRSTKMSLPSLVKDDDWNQILLGQQKRLGFACEGLEFNICVSGNVVESDTEKVSVLLVEDSLVARRMVLGSLEEVVSNRFETEWCISLDDACTKLKESEFNVILLDLSLPDSTGLETCVAMREFAPDMPIVILASDDEASSATEAMKAGAQDYLLKAQVTPTMIARSIHYAMERTQAEKDRTLLQQQLLQASRQAGIAEMATGVLHNVGNVLNSVNLSATLIRGHLENGWIERLRYTSDLVNEQNDLESFVSTDDRGKRLPDMLERLATKIEEQQQTLMNEVGELVNNITHIKEIVSAQQAMAKPSGLKIKIDLRQLMDQALKTRNDPLKALQVDVVREYDETALIWADQHKILQILTNLIKNAEESICESGNQVKRLILRTGTTTGETVFAEVVDSGLGIAQANIAKLFQHGFTTKPEGHGFGLHSSANAASELNGKLSATSEGEGLGATFRLDLPLTSED